LIVAGALRPAPLAVAARLVRARGLVAVLVTRELKARYRGSVLGFLWSLANPLLLLAVYTLVFDVVFQPRWEGAHPYAVFLLCALFPWMWLSGALVEGCGSLLANAGIIRKVAFPIEVLPVAAVLSGLIHFLLALPVLAVALLAARLWGHPVGGWTVLWLPAVVALQLPLLAGSALGLAALHVHFKDLRDLLQNLLTLGFFLTPVLYPMEAISAVPVAGWVVRVNPATPFMVAYRDILFRGVVPPPATWAALSAWTLAGWVAGSALFARLRHTLVEAV